MRPAAWAGIPPHVKGRHLMGLGEDEMKDWGLA